MAKFNWDKLLHTSWFYTKVLFAVMGLMCYHTFMVHIRLKTVLLQLSMKIYDKFYMKKIEEMGLQDEFTYSNDIQFVRAMHKCINYINFSLAKDQRGI